MKYKNKIISTILAIMFALSTTVLTSCGDDKIQTQHKPQQHHQQRTVQIKTQKIQPMKLKQKQEQRL